jgi:MFS family permease
VPQASRLRLPAAVAFPVLALVLFAFFFAASAPSPMFVVLQRAWNFSPSMLTVAYAVYAMALLLSLLIAGSLSDHIGRRPVLLAALLLQTAAMVMFLLARGIGGLIAARIVQGVATGIASGAMSAAVVEAAGRPDQQRLAAGRPGRGRLAHRHGHPLDRPFGDAGVRRPGGAVRGRLGGGALHA